MLGWIRGKVFSLLSPERLTRTFEEGKRRALRQDWNSQVAKGSSLGMLVGSKEWNKEKDVGLGLRKAL